MNRFLKYFYYTFPVQLTLLHFRKSQLLLLFWGILFLTITGHFMKNFGADGLFLAPEYLGTVNSGGAAIVGIACGVFMMSWHITTFILHSTRFRFLAATTNPFLKYCLNNAVIPVIFLVIYFFESFYYATRYELIPIYEFLLISFSFLGGFLFVHIISFAYFFTADRQIIRSIRPGVIDFNDEGPGVMSDEPEHFQAYGLPVTFYASSFVKFRKARDVSHYSLTFLDSIFKRNHFSALVTVLLAFIFLLLVGFFLDLPVFQVPAGASVFITFAVLTAVLGALGYFLRSWNFLVMIFVFIILNTLYQHNIIDMRNKAYGLDYAREGRPAYSQQSLRQLHTPDKVAADRKNMIAILEKWKRNQSEEKPLLVMLNFGGGGLRGASFSMNVLQKLDSATGGLLMKKTVLMSGASGGMLAAAYFRELSRLKDSGLDINLQDKQYLRNISEDLLNPVFSSLIARDLTAPAQKFTYKGFRYVKDRGYAFEQKLNRNTEGVLDHDLGFYKEAEANADIPLLFINAVITRDMKKMVVSTQPVSFMMHNLPDSAGPNSDPDAIDYAAFFKDRSPMNLSLLSALRMNATYPYILPAVWLPSDPVVDVMDAGLRDNFGIETSLRFANAFRDWINENTGGILIIEMRSKKKGSWSEPKERHWISDVFTKPFSMLQNNWFRIQDYFQDDELTYAEGLFNKSIQRFSFMYEPAKEQAGAPLNFHLTANEKREVDLSLERENNRKTFDDVIRILNDSGRHN